MDQKVTFGERQAIISSGRITLDGFSFAPAEVNKLKGLLGITGSMAKLRSLPPRIADPPFKIEFQENGKHILGRTEGPSLTFQFDGISDLIDIVEKSLAVSLDMTRLQPKVSGFKNLSGGTPDIFDGR